VRHSLVREQLIRRPVPEVFAFFARPANLNLITPPSLRFRILSEPPNEMRAGDQIDYQLSLHGIPVRWSIVDRDLPAWDPIRRLAGWWPLPPMAAPARVLGSTGGHFGDGSGRIRSDLRVAWRVGPEALMDHLDGGGDFAS
jgi:hypothetical protein